MGIYIDGFGISGYRSFGKNVQRIGPLGKINIFAGQNNSGKSNILNYLIYQFPLLLRSVQSGNKQYQYQEIDIPIRDWDRKMRVEIGIAHEGDYYKKLLSLPELDNDNYHTFVKEILRSNELSDQNGITWIPFEEYGGNDFKLKQETLNRLAESTLDHQRWQLLWAKLTGQGRGDIKVHWVPQTVQRFVSGIVLPNISIIPAIRRYSVETSDKSDDFSGVGIINQLAKLQNPNYRDQGLKEKFQTINNFVRVVTGNPTATLEIPHDRSNILVHMDEKTLPLTSLGTGIHEVIILASAATVLNDQIVCIEEPELHMHPELQKKFIDYLQSETNNQYFITTHSASILDRPDVSIFHVFLDNGVSSVTPVSSASQRFSVCVDLGYRASDLVQSNSIIWVEGPSDRIYLKWWIYSLDPSLIEGVHYSIMFYGGRLLSHLTANDPEVDEFISLRRLNRNISIVIDSDRKSKQSDINDTKKRVKDEFEASGGIAWITDGREIENYLSREQLEIAAREIHPSIVRMKYKNKYDDPLVGETNPKSKVTIDKVKLAHKLVQSPVNWETLDLRKNTEKMVDFIRVSNHLPKKFELMAGDGNNA